MNKLRLSSSPTPSQLYSSREFGRHFGLCRAARIVTVALLCRVQIFLLTYLLTYQQQHQQHLLCISY